MRLIKLLSFFALLVLCSVASYAAAPSSQAKYISISEVTTTSMKLTWTNGNGKGRVVVISSDNTFGAPATVDYTAVDGTLSNSIDDGNGDDVVAYTTGSNRNVTVTGLTAGTTYYFHVFEYNGSISTPTFNANDGASNPRSKTTLAATTLNAPASLASDVRGRFVTLNWDWDSAGDDYTDATEYFLTIASDAACTTPVDGYNSLDLGTLEDTDDGNDMGVQVMAEEYIAELSELGTYYFRVKALESGTYSDWSTAATFAVTDDEGPTFALTGEDPASTVEADNTITVEFADDVSSDFEGAADLDVENFVVTITTNTGELETDEVEITDVAKTDANTYVLTLAYSDYITGDETITITTADETPIYDLAGNPMDSEESTTLTLNPAYYYSTTSSEGYTTFDDAYTATNAGDELQINTFDAEVSYTDAETIDKAITVTNVGTTENWMMKEPFTVATTNGTIVFDNINFVADEDYDYGIGFSFSSQFTGTLTITNCQFDLNKDVCSAVAAGSSTLNIANLNFGTAGNGNTVNLNGGLNDMLSQNRQYGLAFRANDYSLNVSGAINVVDNTFNTSAGGSNGAVQLNAVNFSGNQTSLTIDNNTFTGGGTAITFWGPTQNVGYFSYTDVNVTNNDFNNSTYAINFVNISGTAPYYLDAAELAAAFPVIELADNAYDMANQGFPAAYYKNATDNADVTLLFPGSVVLSTDATVDAADQAYTTIATANTASDDADNIYIASGTYAESFNTMGNSYYGQDGATITGNVTVNPDVDASDVTIDNIDFSPASGTAISFVPVAPGLNSSLTVTNCSFTLNAGGEVAVNFYGDAAASISGAYDINNNTFDITDQTYAISWGTTVAGFSGTAGSGLLNIDNNEFNVGGTVYSAGFFLNASNSVENSALTINVTDNTFTGVGDGIKVTNYEDLASSFTGTMTITDNTFESENNAINLANDGGSNPLPECMTTIVLSGENDFGTATISGGAWYGDGDYAGRADGIEDASMLYVSIQAANDDTGNDNDYLHIGSGMIAEDANIDNTDILNIAGTDSYFGESYKLTLDSDPSITGLTTDQLEFWMSDLDLDDYMDVINEDGTVTFDPDGGDASYPGFTVDKGLNIVGNIGGGGNAEITSTITIASSGVSLSSLNFTITDDNAVVLSGMDDDASNVNIDDCLFAPAESFSSIIANGYIDDLTISNCSFALGSDNSGDYANVGIELNGYSDDDAVHITGNTFQMDGSLAAANPDVAIYINAAQDYGDYTSGLYISDNTFEDMMGDNSVVNSRVAIYFENGSGEYSMSGAGVTLSLNSFDNSGYFVVASSNDEACNLPTIILDGEDDNSNGGNGSGNGLMNLIYTSGDAINNAVSISSYLGDITLSIDESVDDMVEACGSEEEVYLTASATSTEDDDLGGLSYQWAVWNGDSWDNLSDDADYSGTNTSELTILNSSEFDGNMYQVTLASACSTMTASATIDYIMTPVDNDDDMNVYFCQSSTGNQIESDFTVDENAMTTYTWQYYDGADFVTIDEMNSDYSGADSPTLTIVSSVDAFDGVDYRVVVGSSACSTVVSSVYTVNVADENSAIAGEFTDAEDDMISVCTTAVSYDLSIGSTTSSSVVWSISEDGDNWTEIADMDEDFTGQTGNNTSLTLNDVQSYFGYYFKATAKVGECATDDNTPVQIMAVPEPVASVIDAATTIGLDYDLELTADNTNSVGTFQRWEFSDDAGYTWYSIDNGTNTDGIHGSVDYFGDGNYSASETSLTVNTVGSNMDGVMFRTVYSNGSCDDAVSDPVTVDVDYTAPDVTVDAASSNNAYDANAVITGNVVTVTISSDEELDVNNTVVTFGNGDNDYEMTYVTDDGELYEYTYTITGSESWTFGDDLQTDITAIDMYGNETDDMGVSSLDARTQAVTLSSTVPVDGSTNQSKTANLTATFSTNVTLITAGSITLNNTTDNLTTETFAGNSAQLSGTGTATITINPTANLGSTVDYAVQIGANTLRDAYGNMFAGIANNTTWNFQTAAGSIPTITAGGTAASDNTYITMSFSEGVYTGKSGGFGVGGLTVSDLSLTFNANGGTATNATVSSVKTTTGGTLVGGETSIRVYISVTGTPSGVELCSLAVNGGSQIYSTDGGAMNSGQTTGGITLNDQAAPTLSSSTPADNATGISASTTLALVFNKAVSAGTGSVIIRKVNDGTTVATLAASSFTASNGNMTMTSAALTSYLASSTEYYVVIANTAFKDANNNYYAGISSSTALNFTTTVAAPSAPTSFSVVTKTKTTIKFSYTLPTSGSKGLVVLRQSSSATSGTPVDNTTYAGNLAFGSGDAFGGDANVVSASSSTSNLEVTGLTANTAYRFKIWSYSEVGATVLYQATALTPAAVTTPKFKLTNDGEVEIPGFYGTYDISTVAPNPVSDIVNFTIMNEEAQNFDIIIYSVTGEVVYTATQSLGVGNYPMQINLGGSNIASGTYTLVVRSGENQLWQQISVVK